MNVEQLKVRSYDLGREIDAKIKEYNANLEQLQAERRSIEEQIAQLEVNPQAQVGTQPVDNLTPVSPEQPETVQDQVSPVDQTTTSPESALG